MLGNTLTEQTRKDRPSVREAGYTLIEMSIVMIIVGTLLAGFLTAYNVYLKNQKIVETESNIIQLNNAIGNFRAQYGRYPCPASLTLPRTDKDYGKETDCTDTSVAVGSSVAVGGGYAVEQSIAARTIDHDDNAGTAEIRPRVRRGWIPFKNLNLPEEIAFDGYRNRMNFGVTERLAVAATFDISHGGISIVDGQAIPEPLLGVDGSGHFLIFTSGENEAGAYTKTGVQVGACPASGPESENCNTSSDAVYVKAPASHTGTNTHYDDTMVYYSQTDIPLWQKSDTDQFDIHQRPGGFVGFKDNEQDDPGNTAEVGGKMRAQGKIRAQEICNDAGECMSPSLIGGSLMPSCDPGEYMTGIKDGVPDCEAEIIVKCNPGEVLRGIVDGELDCVTAPCGSTSVSHCGGNVTLPFGQDGDSFKAESGDNFYQWYTCEDGGWEFDSSKGSGGDCSCTPGVVTESKSCGSKFTGSKIVTTTTICPAGVTTTQEDRSACACSPATETRSKGCDSNNNKGGLIQERSFTCPDAKWTKWVDKPGGDTCYCEEETKKETLDCSGGKKGTYNRYRVFKCPGGWQDWTYPSNENSCTCDPDRKETRNVECPGKKVGSIKEERTYNCSKGKWDKWKKVEDNCTVPPPVICRWEKKSNIGRVTTSSMPSPENSDNCTCGSPDQSCFTVGQAGRWYNKWSCQCSVK